jgi:hypothetical protein
MTDVDFYVVIWKFIDSILNIMSGVHKPVEQHLSPLWIGGNIESTDECHNLNAYIFETNNRKVINNTSLDSL